MTEGEHYPLDRSYSCTVCPLRTRLSPVIAHRIATHLDAVSIVDQAVENTVGQSGIADLLVPA
jgi:hypothetical protein